MTKKLPRIVNYKIAFTLIELLIVIAVLGVLTTIVVLRFTGVQDSARDAKRQSELKQYQTSLEVYANKNGNYPIQASATNVAGMCATFGLTGCPDDPKAGQNYKYVSNASGTSYVLWAQLERPVTASTYEYFVVCSDGKVGKTPTTTTISGGTCPI